MKSLTNKQIFLRLLCVALAIAIEYTALYLYQKQKAVLPPTAPVETITPMAPLLKSEVIYVAEKPNTPVVVIKSHSEPSTPPQTAPVIIPPQQPVIVAVDPKCAEYPAKREAIKPDWYNSNYGDTSIDMRIQLLNIQYFGCPGLY
ncbi:MAG: hypothetical protein V4509_00670 [Patescibacteria group bacterium]